MKARVLRIALLILVMASGGRAAADPSVVIGSTKQLLFDDYVVESMVGLTRTLHPCKKHNGGRPVLVPDKPWEGRQVWMFGSVIYNPDKGLYEMWYRCGRFPTIFHYGYATSKDAITWTKPIIPTPRQVQIDYDRVDRMYPDYYGGRPPKPPAKSNLILGHAECQGFVYTPDDPDPSQRYKSCVFGGQQILSPDGVHWRQGNNFYPGQLHTFNYDPVRKLYFGYWIYPPYGVRVYDGTERRVLGFSSSQDWIRWTGSSPEDIKIALPLTSQEAQAGYRGRKVRGKPVSTVEVVISPDKRDDELAAQRIPAYKEILFHDDPKVRQSHFYGMGVLPYESVYIGFPVKLDVCGNHPGGGGNDGTMYVELAFSRDLRHWNRDDRTVAIPNGPPGSWDGGMINVANQPIIMGDEVWMYYGGIPQTHANHRWCAPEADSPWMDAFEYPMADWDADPPSGIGIAKWRLDGFVSLDADDSIGSLVTKPMIFSGNQLEINADAAGGSISIEIQDENGKTVDGYSLADCDPLNHDAVHHIVTWKGRADVTLLSGRDLRLRIEGKNAKLYAFQFIGAGPSAEATGLVQVEEAHVDLTRVIKVGPEVVITKGGRRITMHAANQKCARCGEVIGEFDPARVFDSPTGKKDRTHFHANCAGRVNVVTPASGR